ncbi:unnamed protein product [Blepharisma stoltei]|uniref:Uncharacterized protein n=1 Tax=Blepharisma stoltei TaxID=1481888 RepID=A0AAU9KRQ8_9CILI|nr:unnamed protein product [Blepharisma stoltei]
MGCNHSKDPYDKHTVENQKLSQYEKKLGLNKYSISSYEIAIRRISNAVNLPEIVISQFQHSLDLQLKREYKEALSSFLSTSPTTSIAKLLVSAILFGKGTDREKGEALWFAFDKDASEVLPLASIKDMVKTILQCSFIVTLDSAIKVEFYNTNRLTTWKSKLLERMSSLEVKLAKYFLQEQPTVSKADFLEKMKKPDGFITNPEYIRSMLEHTQVIPDKFANPFKAMKITKL